MVKGSNKNLGMGLSALLGGENKKFSDIKKKPKTGCYRCYRCYLAL